MPSPAVAVGRPIAAKAADATQLASAVHRKAPRVKFKSQTSSQKPVITAVTVIVGLEFLDAWIVRKESFPSRRFWVQTAVLGFGLALLSDLTPRVGKGTAYLVMTSAIIFRSEKIIASLTNLETAAAPTSSPSGPLQAGKAPDPLSQAGKASASPAYAPGSTLAATVGQTDAAIAATPITIFTGTGGAVPAPSSAQYNPRRLADWPRRHRVKDPQGPQRESNLIPAIRAHP